MDMQRCFQATSSTVVTGSASVAASSVSQGDLLHIKEEPEDPDVDIGPTVFQHMDSYYRANQLQSNSLTICSKVTEIPPGSTRAEMSRPKELQIAPSNIPGNKTTFCNYCGQKSTEEDYDEKHLKSCLGQQKDLQQHQLRTTNSDTFNCNTCNRSFHKPHLLSAHQKLHQPNSSKRSVMIGSADAGPSSQDESAKAKLKPFECDVCEKGYFSKAGLIFHKRSHSGIGLCVCYICDAKFPTKSRLINHLRTHTGEKPYHCGNCSARYAQSGDLTTHMRVHTGEKPYDCNTCGAKFARRDVLTRHMKIHTGEKPFECRECGAKFAQSNNFNNHMKNRHSKKEQN